MAGKNMTARAALRGGAALAAAALALGLSGCGGRPANTVTTQNNLDGRLSCAHLGAEKKANLRRMEDLRDERVDNRIRSVSRIPSALVSGNPFSLIVFADPSTAIYREIDALERRNQRIDQLTTEKSCGAAPPSDPRIAAVTPLDDASALYEAQYELSEGAQEALTQEQPEVAPKAVESEQSGEIVATVQSAEQRDDVSAEKAAQEAEAEAAPLGEAYDAYEAAGGAGTTPAQ